ncbi:MAG: glycerate kinase [Pseudomonadota bacterium]
MTEDKNTSFLSNLLNVAIEAAKPNFVALNENFPKPAKGRTVVIAAGKASGLMAKSFEDAANLYWSPEDFARIEGRVITRYGHAISCERIKVTEAAHPVPDDMGEVGVLQILDLLKTLQSDDHVICLFSGGGSALMALPADGISIEDKKSVNKQLLASGATIHEMNCVRRHLSKIKGGGLLRYCGNAKVSTYLVSDVTGDDPSVIASGPTLPDSTTCKDALDVIDRFKIQISEKIRQKLLSGELETLKPGNPIFDRTSEPVILASSADMLRAAEWYSKLKGVTPIILSSAIEGEAKEVGVTLGNITLEMAKIRNEHTGPLLLLSGGETTVSGANSGRGGRNTEFLLSFASTIKGESGVYAIAVDSDGIDGSEESAGGMYTPGMIAEAKTFNLSLSNILKSHNSAVFFEKLGALIKSGPTRTNVNDFRAILLT